MLSELWYFLPPGLPPSFSSSLFLISHPFSYLRPYVSPFVSPSLVISLLPNNPPSLLHSLSPCIPLQWYRKTYAMLSLRSKPPLSLHNHISLYLYFSLSLSFSLCREPLTLPDYLDALTTVRAVLSALYVLLLEHCTHPDLRGMGSEYGSSADNQLSNRFVRTVQRKSQSCLFLKSFGLYYILWIFHINTVQYIRHVLDFFLLLQLRELFYSNLSPLLSSLISSPLLSLPCPCYFSLCSIFALLVPFRHPFLSFSYALFSSPSLFSLLSILFFIFFLTHLFYLYHLPSFISSIFPLLSHLI